MSTGRFGFEIVFLLGGSFRKVIDDLHAELAAEGHAEARPIHGFALQAIGPQGATISELGRRLGVTKQAAAKTAKGLETAGYVTREQDPDDSRATRLLRTPQAIQMLDLSAEFFERRVRQWIDEVGEERFDAMVEVLGVIGSGTFVGDMPGWLNQ